MALALDSLGGLSFHCLIPQVGNRIMALSHGIVKHVTTPRGLLIAVSRGSPEHNQLRHRRGVRSVVDPREKARTLVINDFSLESALALLRFWGGLASARRCSCHHNLPPSVSGIPRRFLQGNRNSGFDEKQSAVSEGAEKRGSKRHQFHQP